jgi:hypothetical protein
MSDDSDTLRIRDLAKRLRAAIEACDLTTLPITFHEFPRGSCGDASLILAKHLKDNVNGSWKRTPPVRFQAFLGGRCPIRRRYWAHSMMGWRRFGQAQPNDAHLALARLEASGRLEAECCSPRTWTGCTRRPGAGRSSTSTDASTVTGMSSHVSGNQRARA